MGIMTSTTTTTRLTRFRNHHIGGAQTLMRGLDVLEAVADGR
jgi:hypothetical protein